MREKILWYAIQYQGDWKKIAQAILNDEPYQSISYPYPYVTFGEDDYPSVFLKLRYPPWILFYQGHLEYINTPCIGMIGARACSHQALVNTATIVNVLKQKYTIVSGLAKGIDAKAHQASLDAKTIAFIGCGIDSIYPKENRALFQSMRKNHLIMSEYPMGVAPKRHHFPWRNRLIASCVQAMIVIEATYKSGTMHTVNACNDLSVPIYCLPTAFENSDFPGCNYLIENGANMLRDIYDMIDIFQLTK